MLPHLDDPVENILVPSFIQDNVVFFAASLLLSDLNQIPALAQQGKHGDADISINKISLFVQQVFQGIYFFSVCLLSLSLTNQPGFGIACQALPLFSCFNVCSYY